MAKLSRRGIKSNPAPKLPVNSAQGKYVLSVLGCRSLGSGKKSTPPQCETRREKEPEFRNKPRLGRERRGNSGAQKRASQNSVSSTSVAIWIAEFFH